MALVIENKEAQELIEKIAASTGESHEEVVIRALRDRLSFVETRPKHRATVEELEEIVRKFQQLPGA